MSVSTNDCSYSTDINLYCNEEAYSVVSSDSDTSTVDNLPSDERSSIVNIFDSELEQMPEPHFISRVIERPDIVSARLEAVDWMLKVHSYYKFRPETAYLSVNYLDCFLSSNSLPRGKGWPLQLLAVACLSLAAKLEETSVPLLLDMQILGPRFLFRPNTIQRMELLVMARLKWRLRIITPFCFLHYFIQRLSYLKMSCDDFNSVFSDASSLIVGTRRVISFLDYAPSAIAAAAVLCATNQIVDDTKLGCFHTRLNKEMVKRCYNLIKPQNEMLGATSNGRCRVKRPCNKNFKPSHD